MLFIFAGFVNNTLLKAEVIVLDETCVKPDMKHFVHSVLLPVEKLKLNVPGNKQAMLGAVQIDSGSSHAGAEQCAANH